jgi:hypothetical protein
MIPNQIIHTILTKEITPCYSDTPEINGKYYGSLKLDEQIIYLTGPIYVTQGQARQEMIELIEQTRKACENKTKAKPPNP